MLIAHKDHEITTGLFRDHYDPCAIALEAGQYSMGTLEPIIHYFENGVNPPIPLPRSNTLGVI